MEFLPTDVDTVSEDSWGDGSMEGEKAHKCRRSAGHPSAQEPIRSGIAETCTRAPVRPTAMSARRDQAQAYHRPIKWMWIAASLCALSWGNHNVRAACDSPVPNCDTSKDYFDTKMKFEHAGSVRKIEYHNYYATLEMKWSDWSGDHEEEYVFVRCGCPPPSNLDGYTEFQVPVSTAFLDSTTVVSRIHLIGQRPKLAAVASGQWITTTQLRDDIENGVVLDINHNYTRLNELPGGVPDVLITMSGCHPPGCPEGWTDEMSARRMIDSDAGETSPLGRAELVKITGILFGAEDTAQALFDLITTRYEIARETAFAAQKRPSVMLGLPSPGWGWSVTRGSSYVGKFLADANVEYKNANDELEGAQKYNVILDTFKESQYWINAYLRTEDQSPTTMEMLLQGNRTESPGGDRSVFPQFRAFKCGNVYSNGHAVAPGMPGNPYFEEGVLRPDLILMDLVQLFHPDVEMFQHERDPHFYHRLAPLPVGENIGSCDLTTLAARPDKNSMYLYAHFSLTGVSQFDFLDNLVEKIQPALENSLGLAAGKVEAFVSNDPPPSDHKFTIKVVVDAEKCGSCGLEGPESMQSGCLELAGHLSDAGEVIVKELAHGHSDPLVQNTVPAHALCHAGDPVISTAFLSTSSSSSSLSGGAIAGIVIGSVVFVAALVLVAVKFSYRKGSEDMYQQLLSKPGQEMSEGTNGKPVNAVYEPSKV